MCMVLITFVLYRTSCECIVTSEPNVAHLALFCHGLLLMQIRCWIHLPQASTCFDFLDTRLLDMIRCLWVCNCDVRLFCYEMELITHTTALLPLPVDCIAKWMWNCQVYCHMYKRVLQIQCWFWCFCDNRLTKKDRYVQISSRNEIKRYVTVRDVNISKDSWWKTVMSSCREPFNASLHECVKFLVTE